MRRLWLVLFLSGCVTAPVQREVERQVTIPGVTFDATWNAVIDIFGERNWTISNMDRSSGFINSDWMSTSLRDGYFDCGRPGILTETNHQGRFNVIVRDGEEGVNVTVNTTWQAIRAFGTNPPVQVQCLTTGLLERALHTEIGERAMQ